MAQWLSKQLKKFIAKGEYTMDNLKSKPVKYVYIVAINWEKAKNEKTNSIERLKYVKIMKATEGSDISNWAQYFDNYANGWRVYIYTSKRQATQLFEDTMKK